MFFNAPNVVNIAVVAAIALPAVVNCTLSAELSGGYEGARRRIDILCWRMARLLPLK